MHPGNYSTLKEFVLRGIPVLDHLVILFFSLLLFIFALSLLGNLSIVIVVLFSYCLHSPMYFFLFNLSILEIGFTFSIIPAILYNLLSSTKTISFYGCLIQCYFYFFLGVAEFLLLAVMSFDRYVAICNPLHYHSIISVKVCIYLVLSCWFTGYFFMIWPVAALANLPFCRSNIIDHFFCDIKPLLALACSNTYHIELLDFSIAIIVLLGSLTIATVSYIYIITTVLRIPSISGRQKAFSTCSAHIIAASIYYGSAIFMYLKPSNSPSLDLKKVVSILTAVITPTLNPFIYTLRNKKVKEALRSLIK
ncbi:olfactory receptor 6M1-like [Pantherophis guttatus]|uniref:Olfactory receptor n=1 Tax=Pantherophis guttatus TaxID=94885 RepID=A0A6P9CI88_PANGU|nr:olfactory receptor 6M1-like [Pantherophis guttatus]